MSKNKEVTVVVSCCMCREAATRVVQRPRGFNDFGYCSPVCNKHTGRRGGKLKGIPIEEHPSFKDGEMAGWCSVCLPTLYGNEELYVKALE